MMGFLVVKPVGIPVRFSFLFFFLYSADSRNNSMCISHDRKMEGIAVWVNQWISSLSQVEIESSHQFSFLIYATPSCDP